MANKYENKVVPWLSRAGGRRYYYTAVVAIFCFAYRYTTGNYKLMWMGDCWVLSFIRSLYVAGESNRRRGRTSERGRDMEKEEVGKR